MCLRAGVSVCLCVFMCVCTSVCRRLAVRLLGLFEALAGGSEERALS